MANILVVGAGAIGGYLGARLQRAGHDVTFAARATRAAQLRDHGLVLHTPTGEEHLSLDVWDPETAPLPAADLVLITVKSPGLEWALSASSAVVGPETTVLPLLNGLAQLDACTAAFGAERVLGGTIRIVVSQDDSGAVVLHQPLHTVTIGEGAERVRRWLDVPGIDVVVRPDILGELWGKWYFIVACGVLACLARGTVGQIVATPGGAELVETVLAETAAVARAAGHPPQDLARSRAFLTAPESDFVPSLYRDIVAGRPGESEHIVGDFVARARALGIGTPLCEVALLQMRIVTRAT